MYIKKIRIRGISIPIVGQKALSEIFGFSRLNSSFSVVALSWQSFKRVKLACDGGILIDNLGDASGAALNDESSRPG